jgi:hypothetical protein
MSGSSRKSRGGVRPGAGRPYKWKHGKTKPIRVPEAIAAEVLAYARELDDRGGSPRSSSLQIFPSKSDSQLVRENKHLKDMIARIYSHHQQEEMLKLMKLRFKRILTGKDEQGNDVDFDEEFEGDGGGG